MAVFLAEEKASARAQNRKNNIAITELKQSSVAGMERGKCFKMKGEAILKSQVTKGTTGPIQILFFSLRAMGNLKKS